MFIALIMRSLRAFAGIAPDAEDKAFASRAMVRKELERLPPHLRDDVAVSATGVGTPNATALYDHK